MKKTISIFAVLLAVLALLLLPGSVFAATGEQVAPQAAPIDLQTFLQWLIGGGGSILAVSWLLERMPWFQRLSPEAKDYTIFGLAAVVGCGALAVVMYVPAGVLSAIAPFFLIIASTFVTVFIAKAFHLADKINKGGDKQ